MDNVRELHCGKHTILVKRKAWYSNVPKPIDLFEEKRRIALEVYNNGYPNIELRKDRTEHRPPNCS